MGAFAITYREFSLTTIAAILTVIGYSMNDTIVVFDRIRENASRLRDKKFDRIVNISINETLSRTILTSATVFFVTLAMNIWGTGVIRDFAFAMNVGVIVGTYSSIFVAAPILIWLNRALLQDRGRGTGKGKANAEPQGAALMPHARDRRLDRALPRRLRRDAQRTHQDPTEYLKTHPLVARRGAPSVRARGPARRHHRSRAVTFDGCDFERATVDGELTVWKVHVPIDERPIRVITDKLEEVPAGGGGDAHVQGRSPRRTRSSSTSAIEFLRNTSCNPILSAALCTPPCGTRRGR